MPSTERLQWLEAEMAMQRALLAISLREEARDAEERLPVTALRSKVGVSLLKNRAVLFTALQLLTRWWRHRSSSARPRA
ncbi:MAG TPA: hypothetical protein P5528_11225 [Steroidobacteraceae bacterium]|nr:hypothetical protein [Steroidobacteraceae bacterium]HRX90002.1 hypothetical protein [Steroidobacteraceae bacterium]